jgi:acetylornithine deacetylase/succinyl-diaminopimelate desuccinylase-like protein
MRMNDTTRAYFERLATVSTPEEAARYNGVVDVQKTAAIQEYFALNEPGHYSNIIKAGYRVNVIPSEAEATLDIRALPDEAMPKFLEEIRRVVNDSAVEVIRTERDTRPGAPPSGLKNEAFAVIEAAVRKHYGVISIPTMSTGATDMAYLRAKGIQSYGIGPLTDVEDGPKGFGAHSDQERLLVAELHRFMRFHWDAVVSLAGSK